MELRRYWDIALRRWWLIVGFVCVAAILGVFWTVSQPRMYTASARVLVSQIPAPQSDQYYDYDHYYNWLASEYVLDDYTGILKSQVFAGDVLKRINSQPLPSEAAVASSLTVSRQHRVLIIDSSWPDPEIAKTVANAAADTLVENRMKYYGRPGTDDIAANVLDYADSAASSSSRQAFNLLLAIALGLGVGLFLTYMLDYLDDTVRDNEDLEESIGLPVVGAIPKRQPGGPRGVRVPEMKFH